LSHIFFGDMMSNLMMGRASKAEQRAACDLLNSVYLIDATNPHKCACRVHELQQILKDGSWEKLGELGGGK